MKLKDLLLEYRRILIILVHLVLCAAAYTIAFLLRFEFSIPVEYFPIFTRTLPLVLAIKFLVFYYFGIYSGLWRYVSITDLWQIIKAACLSSVLFIPSIVFFHGMHGFPRSVFILDLMLTIILVSGIRFFNRLLREKFFKPGYFKEKKKVLIVGAGRAGILMAKECRNNPGLNVQVMGFIDDDPAKRHLSVEHIRILGNKKNIPELVAKYGIEEIIFAIPSARGEVIRDILSFCQIPGIQIKTMPKLDMLLNGQLQLKPRDVRPEDLLGREVVRIDEKEIKACLKGKKVLVTGAGGSIGSELSRQIARFAPSELILLDHNENEVYFLTVELNTKCPSLKLKTIIGDIKDISLLKHTFSTYRPHVVFHAAAHKHVPLMEDNAAAAVKNNVMGTRNVIYASHHYAVERFVLISSDKAVNPINVMGMSKRVAEMILQSKSRGSRTKFMAVRFGNVIGSAGSVVPLFKRQIEEGGPLTITHPDVKRYFMCVNEAVSLVLQAAAMGKGGELFILDMGQQIKITEIAKNLVTLSGFRLHKDIQMKFVGLRPGEKISEQLLLDTERDSVTRHNKIYISHTEEFDPVKLRSSLKDLENSCKYMDGEVITQKLRAIINHNGLKHSSPAQPHPVPPTRKR